MCIPIFLVLLEYHQSVPESLVDNNDFLLHTQNSINFLLLPCWNQWLSENYSAPSCANAFRNTDLTVYQWYDPSCSHSSWSWWRIVFVIIKDTCVGKPFLGEMLAAMVILSPIGMTLFWTKNYACFLDHTKRSVPLVITTLDVASCLRVDGIAISNSSSSRIVTTRTSRTGPIFVSPRIAAKTRGSRCDRENVYSRQSGTTLLPTVVLVKPSPEIHPGWNTMFKPSVFAQFWELNSAGQWFETQNVCLQPVATCEGGKRYQKLYLFKWYTCRKSFSPQIHYIVPSLLPPSSRIADTKSPDDLQNEFAFVEPPLKCMVSLPFFLLRMPRLKAPMLQNARWPVSLNRCTISLAVE